MAWETNTLSQQFLTRAEAVELYLHEVRAKVKSNAAYQVIHDQTLAEFYVYNHLHGRTCLQTRETFVRYLESMSAHVRTQSDFRRSVRRSTVRPILFEYRPRSH
jgi:hypothetical protein